MPNVNVKIWQEIEWVDTNGEVHKVSDGKPVTMRFAGASIKDTMAEEIHDSDYEIIYNNTFNDSIYNPLLGAILYWDGPNALSSETGFILGWGSHDTADSSSALIPSGVFFIWGSAKVPINTLNGGMEGRLIYPIAPAELLVVASKFVNTDPDYDDSWVELITIGSEV